MLGFGVVYGMTFHGLDVEISRVWCHSGKRSVGTSQVVRVYGWSCALLSNFCMYLVLGGNAKVEGMMTSGSDMGI